MNKTISTLTIATLLSITSVGFSLNLQAANQPTEGFNEKIPAQDYDAK